MTRKDGRPRSVAITLPLDPYPFFCPDSQLQQAERCCNCASFRPRRRYSQNQDDYA